MHPTSPAESHEVRLAAAAVLILQFALMLLAFLVLSSAINWPASLDLPASEALPLVAQQASAVALGYGSYFTSAALLVLAGPLVRRAIGAGGALGDLLVSLAAVAGLAKVLGLTRWLFLMPELAAAYQAPGATPETRATLSALYDAFNTYAGAVGEFLGVCLFAGLWTIVLALALRAGGRPRLGLAFLASGTLLIGGIPALFGVEAGPLLLISGLFWQFCLLALAVVLISPKRAVGESGSVLPA
jgi:hypothetical protein